MKINKKIFLTLIIFLNSCAGTSITSIIGNAAMTEGGIGNFISDNIIYTQIQSQLLKINLKSFKNIKVNISNGRVLLTGNVENSFQRLKIIKSIINVKGVLKVYNEIKLNENYELKDRISDYILKSRIKSKLLFKKNLNSNNFSIEVFKKVVYVLGLTSKIDHNQFIEEEIKKIEGVKRIKSFIKFSKKIP